MPQMQFYKAVIRTIDGRTWTSRVNATMVPDDMAPDQIAEAIDNQITDMWHQTLINNRPFQLGILDDRDSAPQSRDSLVVHPSHVVWIKLCMRELRPATAEETRTNTPPTMPEIRFDQTEQPPADGEELPAGSQPD